MAVRSEAEKQQTKNTINRKINALLKSMDMIEAFSTWYCTKHKRYSAVKVPRVDCDACINYYVAQYKISYK